MYTLNFYKKQKRTRKVPISSQLRCIIYYVYRSIIFHENSILHCIFSVHTNSNRLSKGKFRFSRTIRESMRFIRIHFVLAKVVTRYCNNTLANNVIKRNRVQCNDIHTYITFCKKRIHSTFEVRIKKKKKKKKSTGRAFVCD